MQSSAQRITLDSRQKPGVRTKQRFAPTAIQSLEILSLPIVSLTRYAATMVEQNPLLDFDYDESFLQFEELPSETSSDLVEGKDELVVSEVSDYVLPSLTTQRKAFDLKRLQDDCIESETLANHLRLQMSQRTFDSHQRRVIEEIIESIDDDGYFSGSSAMIISQTGIDEAEFSSLLVSVQSCTPKGVAARNLGECLMLQLKEGDPYYEVLASLLTEDIDDLAQRKSAHLCKKYHLSTDELLEIVEIVSCLNPRPGAAFYQQQKTTYLIPDLVIEKQGSEFKVRVTGEITETVTMSSDNIDLLATATLDKDTSKWVDDKRQEAHNVLRGISQRKQTLYRFGLFLVEAQYDFFRYGEARLKPLTMQQVADALSVHVSTVSRTVQDKHILTPWGTYPLKFFFCSALSCVQSERKTSLSSLAIKSRIKELVAQEDRSKPLSDASLMDILNREGVEIKRRTVAKYREALGIEKQSRRRW